MAEERAPKALVLDANILVRAVLGQRVRTLIEHYCDEVRFFAPEHAFEEAREYLPELLRRRGIAVAPALDVLERLGALVQAVELEEYGAFELLAKNSGNAPDWHLDSITVQSQRYGVGVTARFDCWIDNTGQFTRALAGRANRDKHSTREWAFAWVVQVLMRPPGTRLEGLQPCWLFGQVKFRGEEPSASRGLPPRPSSLRGRSTLRCVPASRGP